MRPALCRLQPPRHKHARADGLDIRDSRGWGFYAAAGRVENSGPVGHGHLYRINDNVALRAPFNTDRFSIIAAQAPFCLPLCNALGPARFHFVEVVAAPFDAYDGKAVAGNGAGSLSDHSFLHFWSARQNACDSRSGICRCHRGPFARSDGLDHRAAPVTASPPAKSHGNDFVRFMVGRDGFIVR